MLKKSPQSQPSAAQRKAQSNRDKAIARARASQVQRQPSAPRTRGQKRKGGPGGNGAFSAVSSFFAPIAEGTVMKSLKPMFTRNSANEQRIVHREKIAKLTSPSTGVFTILQSFALNPGMIQSFPWLSNESQGWESYRFNRLRFIWVPSVSTASAGNIIMAPDYDAADSAPAGETQMSSYSDCEEGNIWIKFAAELDPSLLQGEMKRHYIRTGALSANQDVKTYDCGNFFVAAADTVAALSGKLWVEYDITLYNPQMPAGGFQAGALIVGATSMSSTAAFGSAPVITGLIPVSVASNVVTIPGVLPGQEFSLVVLGQGTVMTGLTFTGARCTSKTNIDVFADASATKIVAAQTFTVDSTGNGAAPTITVAYTATTVTQSIAFIEVLSPIPSI